VGQNPEKPALDSSRDEVSADLLVYIPTYNRPESLSRQLAALAQQRADWPGTVRILVSDNASTTLSPDALYAMSAEYAVDVRRNPGNVGANANIALGFVFVRPTEYLWILSDNDTIGPAALRNIAAQGLAEDPDAIVFSTRIEAPSAFVHTWAEAWDGVRENGLISNVIYKSSLFVPQASEAFFYHNTSFPHLCVLLATLRERGELNYRVLPSRDCFAPAVAHGEQPGDYRLSYSGMPQILPLLPAPQAKVFARLWLRDQGREFFRQRTSYPGIHLSTIACLRRYGGLRARIALRVLAIRHALFGWIEPSAIRLARRAFPERLKQLVRSRRS
jgi:glycosyltransferase involved in cell wall biosynthesis